MMINQELKDKILKLITQQWKLLVLGFVILLILSVTLLIPKNKSKSSGDSPANVENKSGDSESKDKSSKNPLDFFGIFSGPEKDDQKNNSSNKPMPTPYLGSQSTESKLTITSLQSGEKKTTQALSGITTASTAQGTVSTHSNIQSDISNNDEVDNIRIVFQNPDGTTTTYIPPGTPPDEIRWGRYTNNISNYSINFPSNWQFFYSIDPDGNEGIALYPPNVDPNDQESPFVGFGIANNFVLPTVGNTTDAYSTPLIADGVNGNLYTNGPLGASYIASVMQYNTKYFGLGSSVSSPTFAYVYYYMLYSLTFNIK